MNPTLPAIPALDPERVSGHRDAHADLDRELRAAPQAIERVFRRFMVRTNVSSLASIAPPIVGTRGPLLFPPPRAFLSAADRGARDAVAAAFRYVDVRLTLQRSGAEKEALLPESPFVLHGLVEGSNAGRETNPGMVRATPLDRTIPGPLANAEPAWCRSLLIGAVERALSSEEPALTRAAWLTFAAYTIHPFVEGNGRVARLLFLLVAGRELPRTTDWGMGEQFLFHKDAYLRRMRAGAFMDSYDGDALDPGPSMSFLALLSTDGAVLMRRRLEAVKAIASSLEEAGLSERDAVVVLSVFFRRFARVDEVSEDARFPYEEALSALQGLASRGTLQRCVPPPSRGEPTALPVFRVTDTLARAIFARVDEFTRKRVEQS